MKLFIVETHPEYGRSEGELCSGDIVEIRSWLSRHLYDTATDEYAARVMTWLEWESAVQPQLTIKNGEGEDTWLLM